VCVSIGVCLWMFLQTVKKCNNATNPTLKSVSNFKLCVPSDPGLFDLFPFRVVE
jgi:hypothetical protein